MAERATLERSAALGRGEVEERAAFDLGEIETLAAIEGEDAGQCPPKATVANLHGGGFEGGMGESAVTDAVATPEVCGLGRGHEMHLALLCSNPSSSPTIWMTDLDRTMPHIA
jgi:hypothetical protein